MKTIQKRLIWYAIILTSVIAVLLAGAIAWLLIDKKETERLDAIAFVTNDDLEIVAGKKYRVSDLILMQEGELSDDYEFEVEFPEQVELYFEYVNTKNKTRIGHIAFEAVDKTAPMIYGGTYFVVPVGYSGDLTNLMLSGDDFDDKPERQIVGKYDLDKPGVYTLEYMVTDWNENTTRQKFTLEVARPSGDSGTKTSQPNTSIDFDEILANYKTKDTKIGIDVSSWQGEIDWHKVKNAGVEFAMIRVGYQAGYDGEYVLDKYFEDNISGATEEGLPVGVYFYSYAVSTEQAARQAKWIIDKLRGYEVDLGIAFDWEDWGSFNEVGMSFYTINQVAKSFLDTANSAGYAGLLYGSKNYLERIWLPREEYGVWLAQYYDYPTYSGRYLMWQMSDSGRIDGIYGNVDVDVLYLK